MEPASRKSQRPQRSDGFMRYAGMATQMAVVIGLGVWGGVRLDRAFPNDFHAWTLSLSLVSVFAATYMVIRDLLKK
jgi:ATP synthase protein I